MKNPRFAWLIREPRNERGKPLWTVGRIAEAVYCSRHAVEDAVTNNATRGRLTRPKLVKFFKKEFPKTWPEILVALGWDEGGRMMTTRQSVPCGMAQVEQISGKVQ